MATQYALENIINMIKDKLNLKYEVKVDNPIILNPIDENSSFGEQIKYYRKLLRIEQQDLADKLNIDRYTLYCIENKVYKQLFSPDIILKIIEELNIKDKIIWNDNYIEFVLYGRGNRIREFRKKENISRYELALKLNVQYGTIKKWENNTAIISRHKFNELHILMENQKNGISFYENDEYYQFINNNPIEEINQYMRKENITKIEFAKRMECSEATIDRWIKGEYNISRINYAKFKMLTIKQKNNIKI